MQCWAGLTASVAAAAMPRGPVLHLPVQLQSGQLRLLSSKQHPPSNELNNTDTEHMSP